jgi:hypothetical protein
MLALNLLLVQVHRNDVLQPGLDQHLGQELASDGAAAVTFA